MIRRREGTLQQRTLTKEDGREWDAALASMVIGGGRSLEGILLAALDLSNQEAGLTDSLRAERARTLKGAALAALSMIKLEPPRPEVLTTEDLEHPGRFPWGAREMILAGFRLGYTLAELRAEIREDERPDPRRRLTRKRYFEARKSARSRKDLAGAVKMSLQKLREWEDRHLEESELPNRSRRRRMERK